MRTFRRSAIRTPLPSSFDALIARYQHRLRSGPPPARRIAEHIRKVGEAQVCTSIIVAAELRYGAAKKGSSRLTAQLETVLGARDVLPFEAPADATYGLIRTRLEQTGQPVGGKDLLIASQAVALGYTIVTDNEGEFARIDNLPRENWLRRI